MYLNGTHSVEATSSQDDTCQCRTKVETTSRNFRLESTGIHKTPYLLAWRQSEHPTKRADIISALTFEEHYTDIKMFVNFRVLRQNGARGEKRRVFSDTLKKITNF